jgi:uncharacterized protein YegP (UPF0339 family)
VPGKFVVTKGTTGKFRFSLVSTNGQVVATSEAYNSKAACMNGVRSVRTLAAEAVTEDRTTRQWAAEEKARKEAEAARKSKKSTSRAGAGAGAGAKASAAAKSAVRKVTKKVQSTS